jgi:hypothetical protein
MWPGAIRFQIHHSGTRNGPERVAKGSDCVRVVDDQCRQWLSAAHDGGFLHTRKIPAERRSGVFILNPPRILCGRHSCVAPVHPGVVLQRHRHAGPWRCLVRPLWQRRERRRTFKRPGRARYCPCVSRLWAELCHIHRVIPRHCSYRQQDSLLTDVDSVADVEPIADADRLPNSVADSDPESYADGEPDADRESDANTDCKSNADKHADSNTLANSVD